jgi:hypothetical protein
MKDQEKNQKEYEDEMLHENELFVVDDQIDNVLEVVDEWGLGLNDDKLHFSEDYQKLNDFQIICSKLNSMLLI